MIARDGEANGGETLAKLDDASDIRPYGVVCEEYVGCSRLDQHLSLGQRRALLLLDTGRGDHRSDFDHLVRLAVRAQSIVVADHACHLRNVAFDEVLEQDDARREYRRCIVDLVEVCHARSPGPSASQDFSTNSLPFLTTNEKEPPISGGSLVS